jgi:hypothetical protein
LTTDTVSSSSRPSMVSRTKMVSSLLAESLDLKQLILNHSEGIKEDEDLRVCYKGLEQDLELLKSEGWIRVITSQKELVLFPVNKDDAEVEVREKISVKTKTLLHDIWDNEVHSLLQIL